MSAVRFPLSWLCTLLLAATLSGCGGGGGSDENGGSTTGGGSNVPSTGTDTGGGSSGGNDPSSGDNPAGGGSGGGAMTAPKISAGRDHTVAIDTDGSLWAWGGSGAGQLGAGPTPQFRSRSPMRIGTERDWVSIAAGGGLTLAIKSDGSLWFVGMVLNTNVTAQTFTRVGSDNDWSKVAAGRAHILALKTDGTLWSWGYDNYGDLGLGVVSDGVTSVIRTTPTRVGTASDWIEIAAGDMHSLAIKSDGTLWAWGSNTHGRLGVGDTDSRNVPTRVGNAHDWVTVSGGVEHSLGIKSDGSLWAWGRNYRSQLGNGVDGFALTPTRVGSDTNWSQVVAGLTDSLAMKSDGSLWAWGSGQDWELGLGSQGPYAAPTQIGTDTDWIDVSKGSAYPARHTVALKSDGSKWSWGYNDQGQLGLGDIAPRQVPTEIPAVPPTDTGDGASSCLVANWKTPSCRGTKQQTLLLESNGSGAFTNPDCNNICEPLVFNFNYTVNGSSVTLHYGAPDPVQCDGFGTQQPPQPNNDTFTFVCSATELTTTTSSGTVTYTK